MRGEGFLGSFLEIETGVSFFSKVFFLRKEKEKLEPTNSLGDKVLSLAPLTRLGDPRFSEIRILLINKRVAVRNLHFVGFYEEFVLAYFSSIR